MNKPVKQPTAMPHVALNKLDGSPIDWDAFEGKFLLFVNVASACGFTPQYKKLQALYEQYADRLEIIGVPCNQFGNQEPGSAAEIQTFCELNYGVTFTLTEKVQVKGSQMHPLYQWLTEKSANGVKSNSVKWNFQKYLVSPEGLLIDFYLSTTDPTSSKITKHLER
ncbi:MAG: glutathione peroxidase [Flavobacteriaceae bacterium]